jgi:polyvinyl alcohol dehydrogenase (cytochrome)
MQRYRPDTDTSPASKRRNAFLEDQMILTALPARTLRRAAALVFALMLVTGMPAAIATAQEATPTAVEATEWPLYGADQLGTRATTGSIDASNVDQLELAWAIEVGGPISATPIIAGGIVYVGAYDGQLYAIDLVSGEPVWIYDTGAAVLEPNLGIDLGITGSAAFDAGMVYVGDASAVVHAVDAYTGEVIWTTAVDAQESASIWSSPVIWDGRIFVGVASIAKEEGFRGSVVALDQQSGDLLWQTFMVPEEADGAGVFAVPAIDAARNILYVGTQNAYSENLAPYGHPISVVALDLDTGEMSWIFEAPPGGGDMAPIEDVGFSASPNLFSVEIDGQKRDLVGQGQKSGDFWALDRDTGEVVWQAVISPPGFLGGMEGTSAVFGTAIAVPATDWQEFEGPATGMVTVLDATTGDPVWTVEQDAPAASPATISNDVVLQAGMDGFLHAYDLTDGTQLWSADLGASVSGGIAVASGTVVLGAATPEFAPFVRPGNTIQAFMLRDDATPVAETEATPPTT